MFTRRTVVRSAVTFCVFHTDTRGSSSKSVEAMKNASILEDGLEYRSLLQRFGTEAVVWS